MTPATSAAIDTDFGAEIVKSKNTRRLARAVQGRHRGAAAEGASLRLIRELLATVGTDTIARSSPT
jgi:hypothetical protein